MGEKGKNVVRKRPTVNIDEIPVNNVPSNRVVVKNIDGAVVKNHDKRLDNKQTNQQTNQPRNKKFITVSYFKSGDPTITSNWKNKLTDVNIIRTKNLTDEFIDFCIANRHRLYLHIEVSGMGQTIFEPNIPSVKHTFFTMEKLIRLGFPANQILVIISPILQNENGLKALKLLLRVFTEFKPLRLRRVRFNLLQYHKLDNGKYVVQNINITRRPSTKHVMNYLFKSPTFYREYTDLIERYRPIITVDDNEESLIGFRELSSLGYVNRQPDGSPVITYEKNQRWKPEVALISTDPPTRCPNKCLLCPFKGGS